MTTRTAFLKHYGDILRKSYPWAAPADDGSDTPQFTKFMGVVEDTISSNPDRPNTWNHDGPTTTAAWKAIGMKGRPTLKALRALPAEVRSTSRALMPCLLAGFVLLHQSNIDAPVTTLGYYGTEARCNHVASSVNGRHFSIHEKAWCVPDDAELKEQGL